MDGLRQSYCPDCLALYPDAGGFCPFHGIPLVALERLPDLSGQVLDGRYRLLAAMPRHGRYGRSYEARSVKDDLKVLVKVFDPMISRDPVVLKRFNRLVTRQLAFKGAGFIRVLDFGFTSDGKLYRVSEWVDGRDLRSALRQDGPPNPRLAVGWALDVCKVVEELHAEGILHLAIKPSNVMLVYRNGGWSAVLGEAGDGGLLLDEDGREYSKLGLSTLESCYVSPEQAAGQTRDVYTDVYALAVLLLEVLSGREPFKARCPVDMFKARLRGGDDWRELMPFDSLPPRLTRTLEMALEPHPTKRLQSASVLRTELELVLKREGLILADLSRKQAEAAPPEPAAVLPLPQGPDPLDEVPEAPVKEDPQELQRIWNELDQEAKAILVAQRKKGWLAAALGVGLLVAVLVVFFQDIVSGARSILGVQGEQEVLNLPAERRVGGPRGDGAPEQDLAAARRRALEQLANKDLPGLGADDGPLGGDLEPGLPVAGQVEPGVDKGALGRKLEQALTVPDPATGRPQPRSPQALVQPTAVEAPTAPTQPEPRGGTRVDPAALAAAAKAAQAAQGPKPKSAEELSREAMDKDDFELARMAVDFGKKQMKKGQYLLAVENFKNAKRMGWHQQSVDQLIADAQRLQKELDTAVDQGRALMRQKKWREAIPYFKRAQQLGDDSNVTDNYILECEDRLQQEAKGEAN